MDVSGERKPRANLKMNNEATATATEATPFEQATDVFHALVKGGAVPTLDADPDGETFTVTIYKAHIGVRYTKIEPKLTVICAGEERAFIRAQWVFTSKSAHTDED